MGLWVVSAGITAILVAVVVGAVMARRVRRGRRVAAERHRAEEVLRAEVLERFRHVRAEWDGPDEAVVTTAEPRLHPERRGVSLPAAPGTGDDLWEGPAHLARAARRGRSARLVRGVLVLLAVMLVVTAALSWFTSR